MTLAARLISDLDEFLAEVGEYVTITRGGVSVTCRASVRPAKSVVLEGSITATMIEVVISPSEIAAAGWPTGSSSAPSSGSDERIPRVNDKIVIKGKERQIKESRPLHVDGVWVRCDLSAAG